MDLCQRLILPHGCTMLRIRPRALRPVAHGVVANGRSRSRDSRLATGDTTYRRRSEAAPPLSKRRDMPPRASLVEEAQSIDSELVHRHVVTAFVQRGDAKVLLVQRSHEVSTYRGSWGGVSGGLEAGESPMARAVAEMEEEVGFSSSHVTLIACGRPLVVAGGGNPVFHVHPFLYHLRDQDAQVVLNWENTAYRWVEPKELAEMREDSVPMLEEAYERLVLPPELQKTYDVIRRDHVHGAADLAAMAIEAFQRYAMSRVQEEEGVRSQLSIDGDMEAEHLEVSRRIARFRDHAFLFATCRPAMCTIANSAAELCLELESEMCSRADPFGLRAREVEMAMYAAVKALSERKHLELEEMRRAVVDMTGGASTVLTLSASSAVLTGLRALAQAARRSAGGGRRLRVVVCESRPLFEGVYMARELCRNGVDCTVITDAQAGMVVPSVDAVLIGADRITRDAVFNKVGSRLVAMAAQAADVPVYAISDSSKVCSGPVMAAAVRSWSPELREENEENDPEEVIQAWPVPSALSSLGSTDVDAEGEGWLAVRNVYFEHVPMHLLTAVITETGVLSGSQIGRLMDRRTEEYVRAFRLE